MDLAELPDGAVVEHLLVQFGVIVEGIDQIERAIVANGHETAIELIGHQWIVALDILVGDEDRIVIECRGMQRSAVIGIWNVSEQLLEGDAQPALCGAFLGAQLYGCLWQFL